jgi:calcium-dependent protein kinase
MIFYSLDENGDGILSKDELCKGIALFCEKFGLKKETMDIDEIIKRIDIDGSGTVDIKEFITATMNLKNVAQGNSLKQAFDLFDIVILYFHRSV